jgi:hypothetical protein
VQVANVPAAEFEVVVESERPATFTALAAMGTKVRTFQQRVAEKFGGKIWERMRSGEE